MKNLQTLKGFRDFLPTEAKKRQYVIETLKKVFASYGFEPLETPALEYAEVLLGKYGEEADKLLYTFVDRGGRKIGMRYDQTVPLSRVTAQYQNDIPLPFKRYQVQPVWRAENTQKGRYREFLQCDIDIVGTTSYLADAEILAVVAEAFTKLGLDDFKLLINDRRTFEGLKADAIITIDKLKKIGEDGVKKELADKGYSPELLNKIQEKKPTDNLIKILETASQLGVSEDRLVFDPTLARGLDYYTGMILEVEIASYPVGSVLGGGRYDNLVGMFAGRDIPAVGVAFGFDRIVDAMEEKGLFKKLDRKNKQVLVTIFSPEYLSNSIDIYTMLREKGLQVELYADDGAKMDKQLKYANKKNVPFVVIIGPEEAEKKTIMLKNFISGEQKQIMQDQLLDELEHQEQ
jgi:histidyl-tRNA synthetase